mmetsp:Transcript_55060/g.80375  ORF Transcript_55060/g.80375 Transcript_55060/m.80375 type:complete len:144 (-) Transcript_55060:99-530(-)
MVLSCYYFKLGLFYLVNAALFTLCSAFSCSSRCELVVGHHIAMRAANIFPPHLDNPWALRASSDDKEKEFGADYYKGMVSSPLKSDDTSLEGRDNLTPNLKLAASAAAIIIGFCTYVVASSPPPPDQFSSSTYSSSSLQQTKE